MFLCPFPGRQGHGDHFCLQYGKKRAGETARPSPRLLGRALCRSAVWWGLTVAVREPVVTIQDPTVTVWGAVETAWSFVVTLWGPKVTVWDPVVAVHVISVIVWGLMVAMRGPYGTPA